MDGGAWCRLLSMRSQRVGHDWATSLSFFIIYLGLWTRSAGHRVGSEQTWAWFPPCRHLPTGCEGQTRALCEPHIFPQTSLPLFTLFGTWFDFWGCFHVDLEVTTPTAAGWGWHAVRLTGTLQVCAVPSLHISTWRPSTLGLEGYCRPPIEFILCWHHCFHTQSSGGG